MDAEEILREATDFYLQSEDFNGYPCRHIRRTGGMSIRELRPLLRGLVEQGVIALVFGDRHPNPHIRAFPDEPIAQQLAKLEESTLDDTCLYPTARHLAEVVNSEEYQDRPYALELALGAGQLEFRTFDLSVLETYRNDPRYYYENDDIGGTICVAADFCLSQDFPEKDKVDLQTFGFAYDGELNRAVAVFCCFLGRLSPEHQQVWRSNEVHGEFQLHPDYHRSCIRGEWAERMSIFTAFIDELTLINQMCDVMDRPPLFHNDFRDNRPRGFSFLVRSTLQEYNAFVLMLDRMMSDNISKKFFKSEVADETEQERADGKVVVKPRGTIAMLQEWLSVKFQSPDPKPMTEMIAAFKEVRRQRQGPAHSLKRDVFDQDYFHRQRELIQKAYRAVRTVRLIFANHPAVRAAGIDVADVLYQGKIWTY